MEYKASDVMKAIDEYVHNERNRHLLKRRLLDGITFDELSYEFNLSVRQVKRIVYRESEKVYKNLSI